MDFIRKRVLAKLIMILIVVVTAISALSAIYFNKKNSDAMRANLRDSMLTIRDISRLTYAVPLWHVSLTEVDVLNNALLSDDNIVAINIFDDSNKFLISLRKNVQTGEVIYKDKDKPFAYSENSDKIKKIHHIVSHGDAIVGSFELFYTEYFIDKEIARRNINMVISFFIIGLSTITVIFVAMRKMLIKPIMALADISREITRNKDYSVRIDKKSHDEIGILYDSINDMLHDINVNEKELQRTKGFLVNIIESMPSILISIDEKGTVTQWNRAAELTTGIMASEILGKNIWESTHLFDDYKDVYKEIINSREPLHLYRQKFEEKELSYKNISLFPLIENGVNGLVIRMDDVTELERKEEQLRQAQKMETIGTLASGLAHDFNNLLGGIVGSVSLLKYKMESFIELRRDELIQRIDTIDKASKRAADLVQQLLMISRKKELSLGPVDLNVTLRNVISICGNTFDKSVELKTIYSDEKAIILGDFTQFEQVLLNLFVNAYHAMTIMRKKDEHQGGTLTVSIKRLEADKYFYSQHPEAKAHAYWVISVQDNGIGMSTKTISKIFDPFYTTKGVGKGTGLGLSVVYNIVKQHKGFIDIYSALNVGSTFNVYLPCIEENELRMTITKDETTLIRGEGHILVVDDESLMRDVAKNILEECGYKVILAENGEEAVRIFRKERDKITMVLLDMVMPKKSGREAYREIRMIDPDVKVLFASGLQQDEQDEETDIQGSFRFIQKPYTLTNLAEAVYKTITAV